MLLVLQRVGRALLAVMETWALACGQRYLTSNVFAANRRAGLVKMEASGALLTSTEMALFELLGGSDHEAFKQVQALVK